MSSPSPVFQMVVSVSTGWIARLSAAIYTFIALPLILNALGADGFAIYLYATNFPTWLVLAMLGAQNSPAYFLARSARRGDSLLLRARLGTALILPICLVILCTIVATTLILLRVVGAGIATPGLADSTLAALLTSLWLTAFLVIGGVFENMAFGLGRAYVFNFVRIGALSLSLIGVVAAALTSKNVALFVFVSIAPQVFLLFTLGSYVMRGAGVMPLFEWRFLRHTLSRINTAVTSGFFLMMLPFVINVQFGPTIIGAIHGAAEVSTLLVLFRVLIFVAAFFAAITATSWPLLGRMHTAGDTQGLRRNAWLLIGGCAALIAVIFLFTAIFGSRALHLWLPGLDLGTPGLILAFACYLSLYLWNTLWLAILCGTGKIAVAGRLSALEAALGLAIGLLLFVHYQSTGYLIGLMAGTLVTTSLFGPIAGIRALAAGSDARDHAQ